ncbi:MAG: hypothetical protein U0984_12500 [Prosthecobacter sp.]|nr:hypothetical protein [Prosthecobacter sp.]
MEFSATLTAPPPLFRPGTSVVARVDPEGAIMTVTDIRSDGTDLLYAVAWLDDMNRRRDGAFSGSDLMPADGESEE